MPPKKEALQFCRDVHKDEMIAMRNWLDVAASRKGWIGAPGDTVLRSRLYIHETFALGAWRKSLDGKRFAVPKITVRMRIPLSTFENITNSPLSQKDNKETFKEHFAAAKNFLKDGRAKVEAMRDCKEKIEMLNGLEWSEAWYEEVRKKIK
jgi:hypothetical protein